MNSPALFLNKPQGKDRHRRTTTTLNAATSRHLHTLQNYNDLNRKLTRVYMRWIAASNRREAVTPGLSEGQRSPGVQRRSTLNSMLMGEKAKQRVKEEERIFDQVSGLFQVVSCGGDLGSKSRRMREYNMLKRMEKDKI